LKLRRIKIENVRSFLDAAELSLDGELSILIGPNGGGKTNVLDTVTTILRRHLLTSWVTVPSPTTEIPDRYEFRSNDVFNTNTLEKHSAGAGVPQRVEVELEVTESDIANIGSMRDNAVEMADLSERRWAGAAIRAAETWDPTLLNAGDRVVYKITDNALEQPQDAPSALFHNYLSLYDVDNRLRNELRRAPLSMPMVSMPVNRSSSGFQASLILANHNDSDYKKSVDAANSRVAGSIVTLAIGRIASRFRILLENDNGTARDEFHADPQITSLTNILQELGYTWDLECTNPLTNQYDVRLTKQGSSFLVNAASSGEKELLTYLFAIYALNVRDALIVIDEPELHLHPRWQATLLSLFERLSIETNNQFLMATHSPVFVSPSSIPFVSRVYSSEQKSKIIRLESENLPNDKHLFSIVNSQNNERMFFSDKVVLVEGISDRLFFEAVFKKLGISSGSTDTLEVIEVLGKGFFAAYEKILHACQVPYAIIADLDYINNIGTGGLKSLFTINEKNITRNVIDNPVSVDGNSLVARLESAIASGDTSELAELWEYIKRRQRRLRTDMTEAEVTVLEGFMTNQRENNVFVLSKGSLEAYLPDGYRGKDIDKLIELLDRDFWNELSEDARAELQIIAEKIKSI
jgi:ABC-type lipoprotein export system ATPase subunit